MSDLIIAANRGPYSVSVGSAGALVASPASGGLAPSLASALSVGSDGAVWVAAAMTKAERSATRDGSIEALPGTEGVKLTLVDLDEDTYAAAYDVIANATLWFMHHGLFDTPRRPIFDRRWREAWEGFRAYNSAFASEICELATPGAHVLVNDYHLALVGRQLAEERGDLHTVHFSHTPFASLSEINVLPRDTRRELLAGLVGFGACGFHTTRWQRAFDTACRTYGENPPPSFAAALGADVDRLAEVAASPECATALGALEELVGERRMILRSDRVELSKNILRGLLAFDALLEERPEWRGRVCLVARSYPSRQSLAEYLAYRSEVEHLAERLNDKWAGPCGGEEPIISVVDDDFASSVAALRRYDVLLVNPIRDGMNLVAKEGPTLNERDGVLVCSEEAGAYEELSEAALGIQPFDVADTAAALARGLEMPAAERARRAAQLKRASARQPPSEWLQSVLSEARRPASAPVSDPADPADPVDPADPADT